MAKVRWQEKTYFHFRSSLNSIYSPLETNLRILVIVGFAISKANNLRKNELAPKSWPPFSTPVQIMPCCMLKEDIRVWSQPLLLAVSHFPSLLQHPLWHMLVPKGLRNSKGLLLWQPRQLFTSACFLQPSPCPPLLLAAYCADQRSGDKCFRGRIVYLAIQMLIFKALLRILGKPISKICTMKTTHAENYSWLGKEHYLWKCKAQL